ncbi:MAG TPA: hypothetical protein VM344_02505, partial [Vitreimonas sp.]|nr:hypothetical protein [Vitreimonas sp.]
MLDSPRRFKAPLVALVVLALSAGAAFGREAIAEPSNGGTEVAGERAGFTVPVAGGHTEPDELEPDELEPDELEPQLHPDGHGALVSAAARLETPAGFRNHGEFVSCVARVEATEVAVADLSTLTPDDCDAVDDDPGAPPEDEEEDEVATTDNHGAVVASAARMETPEGFANHGEFVRCVARDASLAASDLESLTPGDCAAEDGEESVESDDQPGGVIG